jgi:hypothetical protein
MIPEAVWLVRAADGFIAVFLEKRRADEYAAHVHGIVYRYSKPND